MKYKLPEHFKVRIIVNFHFMGLWTGGSGFIKLREDNKVYTIWLQSLDSRENIAGTNILTACGNRPNSLFSDEIDLSFDHTQPEIELIFGSTLKSHPCDASYGISNIQIYYE